AAGGRISFSCGAAPAVIKITAPLQIKTTTQLDGAGRITLQGAAAGPLFQASARLELDNLQGRQNAAGAAGILPGRSAEVVLRGVTTSNTSSAYVAAGFSAEESRFESNGSASGMTGAIIDAERVQLNKASFNKNVDHPIAGGQAATGRAALNRQITIDASNFMGNAASILALDAVVTVRDSKFSGNGSGPAASGASWGCCAGVLTAVNSKVFFYDSELVGNGAAGFGGAILAIGSEVHLVRTLLQSNRARIGGAVFSWGQAI